MVRAETDDARRETTIDRERNIVTVLELERLIHVARKTGKTLGVSASE